MKCGLLGRKLGHSYSPQIHAQLADYPYSLFEREPEQLEEFLKHGDFSGLNVTIPYKKDVIAHCAELSDRAKELGSVNTIVRREDGSLIGHNTDYFGFLSMVDRSGLIVAGKKVLVLGSGGASVTAVAVLKKLGANVIVISRTGENNYNNLHLHQDAAVLVNTTPVGMYPATGLSPIDLSKLPKLEGVLDVIYNPARTQLLMDAENRGLITMNGLWMLVAQAKESAEWFSGHAIPDSAILSVYKTLKRQMENVVLVGMPGCGKSTVGKQLANALHKTFIDADAAITEEAGMSIPEIFARDGEPGFRAVESKVLSQLGKQSACVIATGGGCVTKEENYAYLHQNGTIYWLQRDIHELPKDGRPLSLRGNLEDMYQVRKPLYQRFADHIVENNRKSEDAVQQIISREDGK